MGENYKGLNFIEKENCPGWPGPKPMWMSTKKEMERNFLKYPSKDTTEVISILSYSHFLKFPWKSTRYLQLTKSKNKQDSGSLVMDYYVIFYMHRKKI